MRSERRSFLFGLAGLAMSKAALGPVTCRVVDRASGQTLAARLRLLRRGGVPVVPLGHPATLSEKEHEGDVRFQSQRFAYTDGSFQIDPAWLPLQYQVIKGHQYAIQEGELHLTDIRDGAITIPISRWSAFSPDWYSGDIHIHYIAPQTCHLEMDAEDLNVANILTSDFTDDQENFRAKIDPNSSDNRLIYVNQEFRNDQLGHLCLLNLRELIRPVKPMSHYHYPLHLSVCDKTHAQGGYVSWAHFPSWPGVESPVDVAAEKLDGLEILCQIDPWQFPIFMTQVVPDLSANHGLRLWYRYLNCGFRLSATAGTDKMTNFVTVGANRVYAHVKGPFHYDSWIEALKAGRTFVSNSPFLSFTVNGQEPGAILNLNSRATSVVRIHAVAESQLPYSRLEIVVNGEAVADSTPMGAHYRSEIHLEHPVRRSCWIAARAYEDPSTYTSRGTSFTEVHAAHGTLFGNYYGTRRPETVFAHSSPVYVIRDHEPIRSWGDAQYYVRYIDRSMEWLRTQAKFAHPQDRQASLDAFLTARAVYQKRAREAQQTE
jgi:hypothetical protein